MNFTKHLFFALLLLSTPFQVLAKSELGPGERLTPGQKLDSVGPGIPHTLEIQKNSNVVIFFNFGGAIWSTGTEGTRTSNLLMKKDGNLVLLDINSQMIWQSGTAGHHNSKFRLESSGEGKIYAADGRLIWDTKHGINLINVTGSGAPHINAGYGLSPGNSLKPGEMLVSRSEDWLESLSERDFARIGKGTVQLKLSLDGQLGLYGLSGGRRWNPDQKGRKATQLTMRKDGNMVLLDAQNKIIWQTSTSAKRSYVEIDRWRMKVCSTEGPAVWTAPNDPGIECETHEAGWKGSSLSSGDELGRNWGLYIGRQGKYTKNPSVLDDPEYYGMHLIFEANGNLVLYQGYKEKVIWSSGTAGEGGVRAALEDGNLVIYAENGDQLWETNTGGNPGATLQIDGWGLHVGARIISKSGKVLWEKGSGFKRIYRLQWDDIYMSRYKEGAKSTPFIFGKVNVKPFGNISYILGNENIFWSRSSAAGQRVRLDENKHYKKQYPGEFEDKYQIYTIIPGVDGNWRSHDDSGVEIEIDLWDWDRFSRNDHIGTITKKYYFKDLRKLRPWETNPPVKLNLHLSDKGGVVETDISADFIFKLSRIQ